MSEERIVRRTLAASDPDRTDLRCVAALTDEEIERAIAADPDAAPPLDDDWFARAELVMPPDKEMISIRLDKDVLDFFRQAGRGYPDRQGARVHPVRELRRAGLRPDGPPDAGDHRAPWPSPRR